MFLINISTHLPEYILSHPRRLTLIFTTVRTSKLIGLGDINSQVLQNISITIHQKNTSSNQNERKD